MNKEQAKTLEQLTTEGRNPASSEIDSLTAIEIVRLMNSQDATIAESVLKVDDQIAAAIDLITEQIQLGGRLVYIGAGTSGRLGVLDASECPPTFSTPPEMVVGVIAGILILLCCAWYFLCGGANVLRRSPPPPPPGDKFSNIPPPPPN